MVAIRAQASRPVTAAKAVIRVPAPLAKFAKVAGASAAAFSLTLAANAAVVKMGGDDGSLVFVPSELTVKSGETVQWVNNAGFPHNLVFDEDNVPDGVNAEALSNEDYMNAPGETVTRKFDTPGTYGYYCEPHQGAGMTGTITVK